MNSEILTRYEIYCERHQGCTLRMCGKCHIQWIISCHSGQWSRDRKYGRGANGARKKNGCADEARHQFTLHHPTAVTMSIRPIVF
jgi:hypothetical protein